VPDETPREMKVVQVVVDPDINAEQITELLVRFGAEAGCRRCGLLGFDIRLTAQDSVTEVPAGVRSLVVSRG
jgi:hypothetical protein